MYLFLLLLFSSNVFFLSYARKRESSISPASTQLSADFADTFSSFRCLGASQAIDTNIMRQATFKKFPLNDPEHRTCLFRNVCVIDGSILFFQRNQTEDAKSKALALPLDYTPQGSLIREFQLIHAQYSIYSIRV